MRVCSCKKWRKNSSSLGPVRFKFCPWCGKKLIKKSVYDLVRSGEIPVFSGIHSCEMWAKINNAKSLEDLQSALYTIGCRLQDFEAYVRSE